MGAVSQTKWTIGICTWNRGGLLKQTISSLEELRGIDDPENITEVVIVNNGSTDDTVRILKDYKGPCRLRQILETKLGHTHARNRLVREATGEFILWTDDDVLLDNEWLREYQAAIAANPNVAFFGGPIVPKFLGRTPGWIQRNYEDLAGCFAARDLGNRSIQLDKDRLPYGANFAVKTSVALQYPFDARLGRRGKGCVGDDEREFLLRLLADGHQGLWVPEAQVQHLIPKERANLSYVSQYFAGQAEVQWLQGTAPKWTADAFAAAAKHHRTWLKLTRCSTPSKIWLNHVIKAAQFQRWAELEG